jgi:hypothetical protein
MVPFILFFVLIIGVGFVSKSKKITGSDHPFEKIFKNKDDR